MVTSAELDQIRADVGRQILDHVCDIQRNTGVANPDGHLSVNWTSHLTNVPCHMATVTGREIVGDQVNVEQLVDFINMPFATDVTNLDRISQIRNQKGEIISGPLRIKAVTFRPTHLMVYAEADNS